MSAFNWIEFRGVCQVCRKDTGIRAQTHIAASFNGDSRGRFRGRTYSLGQEMLWWQEGHPERDSWGDGRQLISAEANTIRECCYAVCVPNDHKLYAVIEFANLRPVRVLEIGRDEDWPASYSK
jgi:hypothetical protein